MNPVKVPVNLLIQLGEDIKLTLEFVGAQDQVGPSGMQHSTQLIIVLVQSISGLAVHGLSRQLFSRFD